MRPRCCWPGCANRPLELDEDFHLCAAHGYLVIDLMSALSDDRHRAEQVAEAKAREGQPGWVYYLRIGDQIKIGYSSDVKRRMKSYPPTAELLAVHPGSKALERTMHEQFASSRAIGREWFHPHAVLTEHIAKVVEHYGKPSRFAYHYRRPVGHGGPTPRGWSGRKSKPKET
jgi:hypothetical protein